MVIAIDGPAGTGTPKNSPRFDERVAVKMHHGVGQSDANAWKKDEGPQVDQWL